MGYALVEDGFYGGVAKYYFAYSGGCRIAVNDGFYVGGEELSYCVYLVDKIQGYLRGFFAVFVGAVGFEAEAAVYLFDEEVVDAEQMSEGVVFYQINEGFVRGAEESGEDYSFEQLHYFAYCGYGGCWLLVKRYVLIFGYGGVG